MRLACGVDLVGQTSHIYIAPPVLVLCTGNSDMYRKPVRHYFTAATFFTPFNYFQSGAFSACSNLFITRAMIFL